MRVNGLGAERVWASVLQVLAPDGTSAGTAFLVSRDVIVTCAHVVADARPADAPGPPDDAVSVRLPQAGDVVRRARPIPGQWRSRADGDVAFLRVEGDLPGLRPVELAEAAAEPGRRVVTLGFPPAGASAGVHDSAVVAGSTRHRGKPRLQLGEAWTITQGFSGAPVLDDLTGLVVGMVADLQPVEANGRGSGTCYAVPVEVLQEVRPQLRPTPAPPYLGLQSFGVRDAHLFHGREETVETLVLALRRDPRFLAVLGPSGSGKSSLVGAGLVRQIKDVRRLPRGDSWTVMSIRPADDPLAELVRQGLTGAERDLAAAAASWLRAAPADSRLMIVVDQLEELLTAPDETAERFLAELARLADDVPRVTTVVVMRDDFYAGLAATSPALMQRAERNLVNVPPRLDRAQLRRIIEEPARRTGSVLAPGLADVLVDQATGGEDDAPVTVLPLLEFTLTELWHARVGGRMSATELEQLGGVTGGLSRWCDRAYEGLDEGGRTIARRVLTALVIEGEPTTPVPAVGPRAVPVVRRRRSLTFLETACSTVTGDAEPVRRVVDALVEARLLVTQHARGGGGTVVELVHDAVVREWPLFAEWLEFDREYARWERSMSERATVWRTSGSVDELLGPSRLAEADRWLAERPVPQEVADLVAVSRATQRARRRRRFTRRTVLFTVLAAVVAAIVVAGLLVRDSRTASEQADARSTAAQEAAESAQADNLANAALQEMTSAPDYAALTAEAALQLSATPAAYRAASAILAIPSLPSTLVHDDHLAARSISFAPDGRTFVTTSVPRAVQPGLGDSVVVGQLWDAARRTQLGDQLHVATEQDHLYDVDGRTLATLNGGVLKFWDAGTQRAAGPALRVDAADVTFFAGGRDVMAVRAGRLAVWEVATRRQLVDSAAPDGRIVAAGTASDGRSVAAVTGDGVSETWSTSGRSWTTGDVLDPDLADTVDVVVGAGADRYALSGSGRIVWFDHNADDVTVADHGAAGLRTDSAERVVAFTGPDGQVRLWRAAERTAITLSGSAGALALDFEPGRPALAVLQDDGDIRFWDTDGEQPMGSVLDPAAVAVVVAARADRVATTDPDAVRIWDLAGQRVVGSVPLAGGGIAPGVALSPDGRRLTTLSASTAAELTEWDVGAGIRVRPPVAYPFTQVMFAPDGRTLVAAGRFGMSSLRADTLEPITGPSGPELVQLLAVGTGPGAHSLVVTSSAQTAQIRAAGTWWPTTDTLVGHGAPITSASLSADGTILATASEDGTVRLWDARTGQQTGPALAVDQGSVYAVAMDPAGRWVATVSGPAVGESGQGVTLHIWDVRSHSSIGAQPLPDSPGAAMIGGDVVVSPDGKWIVTAGPGGARLWAAPSRWAAELCSRAGRNLTRQEWRNDFNDRPYERVCPEFSAGA